MRIWSAAFLMVGLLWSLSSRAATPEGYYLTLVDSSWRTTDGMPLMGIKKSDDQICRVGGRCYRLFVAHYRGDDSELSVLMKGPRDSAGRVELDRHTGRTLYLQAQRKFWRMLRNN
jgi:hypothetical protein